MRSICFSCPSVFLKRPIAEIIKQLNKYECDLLIPKDFIKGFISIHFNKIKNTKIYNYNIFNLPFFFYDWPIPISLKYITHVINLLKKNDIMHIWVPIYLNNILIVILKKLFFPKKKLYISMDAFPGIEGVSYELSKTMNLFFKIYYKSIGKVIFKLADKIIIYGNSWKNFALKAGVPEDKIKIIRTGVYTNTKEKDKDIREEFNIDKHTKIILYIGLLNDRKGIDIIIKTAKELKDLNIKFIIVGDGPKRGKYEKLIKMNNLANVVTITGFRKDVHNFYLGSDLFFFPSRGEGLPGVLMESMVYGLPIICSDITGNRDLIQNNQNGFLCPPEDIRCYMSKIKILLEDRMLRKKFIENSLTLVNQKFNWNKIINQYRRLYNSG